MYYKYLYSKIAEERKMLEGIMLLEAMDFWRICDVFRIIVNYFIHECNILRNYLYKKARNIEKKTICRQGRSCTGTALHVAKA